MIVAIRRSSAIRFKVNIQRSDLNSQSEGQEFYYFVSLKVLINCIILSLIFSTLLLINLSITVPQTQRGIDNF